MFISNGSIKYLDTLTAFNVLSQIRTHPAYIANAKKSCYMKHQLHFWKPALAGVNCHCKMISYGVTSFLHLKDVTYTCKHMRNSPTIGRISSVQWRKVGSWWRLQMCFRRLLCVWIEIDLLKFVNCCVITHCLSVSCMNINHLRCTLAISLQMTSKQWIIIQQFTARVDLYLKYCIKSVLHAFNSHVSMSTNPFINKAAHMLLKRSFGTLNTLVLGFYTRNKWKHNKQIRVCQRSIM